jgi:hypothetical protein
VEAIYDYGNIIGSNVRTVTGSEPCSPASILVYGVGKGFIPHAAEILIFFERLVGDCMMYSCKHCNEVCVHAPRLMLPENKVNPRFSSIRLSSYLPKHYRNLFLFITTEVPG